jgi:hypothetical protein
MKHVKQYGQFMTEAINGGEVICNGCGWNWKISEGGQDPFLCHKCGCNNGPGMNEATSSELTQKFNETAQKLSDSRSKQSELKSKLSDQKDPLKAELIVLQIQKEEVKQAGFKLDMKILDVKRAQLMQ